MKKVFALLAVMGMFAACHYLKEEAKQTIETNDLYKNEKAEYSVNRANVEAVNDAAPLDTAKADTADTN